ncbi:ATP-dependent RNA helicase RhlE [Mycobacterium marinum]|nr:ATP-dependent RNA helicase RhlE [Mycobacterium marinum]
MIDRLEPLETAKQIEGSYKRYLKTLLAPRDEQLAAAFDAEIDATTMLTKGPILEMTPPYETGATCRQLIDQEVLHQDFVRVDGQPFSIDQPLYVHQESAIRKFVAGRNLVVSTGTGSGKTESFLVPIVNSLLEESARGTLGPGVRALLLYPMNALANDQLKRLRSVLAGVPEITFGRYTGETLEDSRAAESDFLQSNPGTRRLPNELLSRDEMRSSPPHLLLTNYAMLEYLLLRPADIDLFDGPFAGTWRFIVMDEAHVYDGAQGSEVALLMRRLQQRVAPDSSIQCIATSASLTGSVRNDPRGEAMEFAANLFDAPFEYVEGDLEVGPS